jgi:DNA-binding beta-propeller fold protein YncE
MDRKADKILIAFFLLLLAACVKDKPTPPVQPPPAAAQNNDVFVVCEGRFGDGNGSLYLYLPDSNKVYADVFTAANNNQQLGDVFQSMERIGDSLYLCVNNSDKIVVINRKDKKLAGIISIPKPRYILPVSKTKAYVSTIFSDKLYIINPKTLQVTGSISMPHQNPEGMVLLNNKAYTCTWDTATSKLYAIDVNTDQLVQTIDLAGRAPQEIVIDKQNRLWILSGNVSKNKSAALTCVDPITGVIVTSLSFPAFADPLRLVINKTKDTLYFIEVNYYGGTDNNGVYRMAIDATALPTQPFITAKSFQYFWGLAIDTATNKIYIGDPKGFIQKGSVAVYDPSGNKLTEFNAGVGPGHFYFER